MRQIVFCFLAVSLFFSCKPAEKSASLTGTKWVLESMNGREVKLKEPTSEVFMTLEDGKVNGKAGCNSFFGSYELGEGNQLDFGPMGATKMACPVLVQRLLKTAGWFMKRLWAAGILITQIPKITFRLRVIPSCALLLFPKFLLRLHTCSLPNRVKLIWT